MAGWARKWLGVTVLVLLVPIVAVGQSNTPTLEELEARVATLEAFHGITTTVPTTTTTVPQTTIPPSTTTTHHDTTTTTVPPTTTTTVPPTTTTVPPTTTTTTTTHPDGIHLVVSSDTEFNGPLILRAGDSIEFRNGAELTCGPGCFFDFQGTPTSTWSNDGLTQNLERDIKITGNGYIKWVAGSLPAILRYVEIEVNSGTCAGCYPLHWHLNGNGSRGTLVEGVVIKNSPNHAFVPHGSHGITFRDTIAVNTAGDPYWWNPPDFQSRDHSDNTDDVLWDHALADGVTNAPGDPRGFRLSAFRLAEGHGNAVINSVARNVNPSHPKNCSGFHWPEAEGATWIFTNNASFRSACNGIFVWQNNQIDHIIDGFRGDGIEQGAYTNRYDYRNVDVDFVISHAVGWSINGGSLGDVVVRRQTILGNPVRFSNVLIASFTMNNAENGGSTPATFILTNTNLHCEDIVFQSVVPGTQVVIDSVSC